MISLRDAGSRIAAAVAAALFFVLIFVLLRSEFKAAAVPIVIASMILLGAFDRSTVGVADGGWHHYHCSS